MLFSVIKGAHYLCYVHVCGQATTFGNKPKLLRNNFPQYNYLRGYKYPIKHIWFAFIVNQANTEIHSLYIQRMHPRFVLSSYNFIILLGLRGYFIQSFFGRNDP